MIVTCAQNIEKGTNSFRPTEGKYFSRVVNHKKDKVKPMAVIHSDILINNGVVSVNIQLFNRIIVVMSDENELKKCFEYELAGRPRRCLTIFL